MLVLFTSYAMLNKVYTALKEAPSLKDYTILGHGHDGSRSGMIERLQNEERVVLLGANSFWEGVDIKHSKLKAVVITKLPFSPPTMPIESAKSELLQRQGKNSFNYLSLPKAILRFRQGVGRLIRSSSDCGVIIVLDNRILSKSYGKAFVQSLPKQPIWIESMPNLISRLKEHCK